MLVAFNEKANDAAEFKDSEYGNIRAQMYYEGKKFLMNGGILDSRKPEWIPQIEKQLAWTKGTRHKTHGKKMAEPKLEIKKRVGKSPDVADGFVLGFAYPVTERLPENAYGDSEFGFSTGQTAYTMPDHGDPYADLEAEYEDIGY